MTLTRQLRMISNVYTSFKVEDGFHMFPDEDH